VRAAPNPVAEKDEARSFCCRSGTEAPVTLGRTRPSSSPSGKSRDSIGALVLRPRCLLRHHRKTRGDRLERLRNESACTSCPTTLCGLSSSVLSVMGQSRSIWTPCLCLPPSSLRAAASLSPSTLRGNFRCSIEVTPARRASTATESRHGLDALSPRASARASLSLSPLGRASQTHVPN
jgi:hypothetical protein